MRSYKLPFQKTYTLNNPTEQKILYLSSGLVFLLSFVLAFFSSTFFLSLFYGLVTGIQTYYLVGYYFYGKQEQKNIQLGKESASAKRNKEEDLLGHWPEIEKPIEFDREKNVREKRRAELTSTKLWNSYKRKIFVIIFLPLLIIHLFVSLYGDIGTVWKIIQFVSSAVFAYFFSKSFAVKKFNKEAQEFLEKYKEVNEGYIVQTQIPIENKLYPQQEFETHGSATWLSEFEKNVFSAYFANGLWIGNGFFHDGEGGLITIASTRSGKGAGIILPNLLLKRYYAHSFVILDPKGTNACVSASFQKAQGQEVIILDPTGIQTALNATHGVESSTFNVLDVLDRNNLVAETTNLARLLIPQDQKAEKYWTEEAVDLYSAILLHIMTFPKYEGSRDLVSFYEFIRHSSWVEIFEEMSQNDACDYEIKIATAKFLELYKNSEKTFTSIVSVGQQGINWLKDPVLKSSIRSTSFDPYKISTGGLSIYLCVPLDNSEGYFTWSRLMIYALMKVNRAPLSHQRADCYYILDEFPQLGKFTDIQSYLATSSEFKIRIWMFIQNIPQLDDVYGASMRDSFIGNCRVLQAFGVKELTTAKMVSEMLGSRTLHFKTVSENTGYSYTKTHGNNGDSSTSENKGYSINENLQARSLLNPDEVMNLSIDVILNITDVGRFRLYKWQYWMKPNEFSDVKVNQIASNFDRLISMNADENPNYSNLSK